MNNEPNNRVGLFYAYNSEGRYVGSANIFGRERLQEEFPEWEWLGEEEHDLRQEWTDKRKMRALEYLREAEISAGVQS